MPPDLNLSTVDRDAVRAHLRRDPVLRPLVDALDFPEERIHLSAPYPALLRSVVGQQVSTKAAAAIYRRFLAAFDLAPDDPLAAPPPGVLAEADRETLRAAGLSYAKADYVRDIGAHFHARPRLPARLADMPDEAVVAELTQIRGVGRWTVEMVMLFALGRADLLPLDDLAVYQTMLELYGLDPDAPKRRLRAEMTGIAEAWRPYRSAACLYLYAWRNRDR